MSASDYYKKQHDKELRTLAAILKKIKDGVFWIRSISFQQELMGSKNYRLIIYLRERE